MAFLPIRRKKKRKTAYYYDPQTKKHRWLQLALLFVGLAVFVYGAVRLGEYIASSIQVKQVSQQVTALYEEAPEETTAPVQEVYLADNEPEAAEATLLDTYQYIAPLRRQKLDSLWQQNNDLVAWLTIDGVVSQPVVYRDNSYYINHDFYGKKSSAGMLFLDELSPLAAETQNLLIHGHNMKDGSMFAMLTHYKSADFAAQHTIATLDTLYRTDTYVLIAVLSLETMDEEDGQTYLNGDALYFYSNPRFYSEEAFENYKTRLYAASTYHSTFDLNASDALLSLSTCISGSHGRIMTIFRRLRDGENINTL